MTTRTLTAAILLLTLHLDGCAVCKSSDSAEVCRTKERNHSQPRIELGAVGALGAAFAARAAVHGS